MDFKKKKNLFFKNKKASEPLYNTIIFIIISVLFLSLLLVFVYRSSTGALTYEQLYAKQIALLIDKAKPMTNITLDFEKGVEIAKENGISPRDVVREKENMVIVKLSEGKGYGFRHFSDNEIDFDFDENKLIIFVKGRTN